jgi:hypothetical protein
MQVESSALGVQGTRARRSTEDKLTAGIADPKQSVTMTTHLVVSLQPRRDRVVEKMLWVCFKVTRHRSRFFLTCHRVSILYLMICIHEEEKG